MLRILAVCFIDKRAKYVIIPTDWEKSIRFFQLVQKQFGASAPLKIVGDYYV